MNLRQLEIFRAIMHCRTTVAAAEDLGVSQSAVSNALKHMETRLGFRLFERGGNGLVPTEEARILIETAEPLFLQLNAVKQRAQDLRAGIAGRLRIVSTAELSTAVVPAAVSAFLSQRGEVRIGIETESLGNVLEMVENGVADVGFAMEAPQRNGLSLRKLAKVRAVCLCQADHPIAQLDEVTPQDLADVPLVGPQPTSRIGFLVENKFRDAGVPYAPVVEVRFLNTAALVAEQGFGVGLIDEFSAGFWPSRQVKVLPFVPPVSLTLSAVVPDNRAVAPLADALIDVFEAEIATRLSGSVPTPD
ncbi:LysR family transcriptional regulator [Acuticoccus sp. MNP-M23]|uniref:LysR family transcriptional regulator n=1 Tax=Acuticoccus sp. MNP-M23 TaxID=3072793 RepID=UPI002815FFED|nr:LysR family transcriptional regulator [Acuticoccus sp. MNP-M23]WMS42932.1 LysR family transcriptional regulator [Acuticoccus sp. MNP-M23]